MPTPENRLIFPVQLPKAWNIGPILPESEQVEVTAHVFGPRSNEVRFHTGKLDPAVLIIGPDGVRAALFPEQIAIIVKHWRRLGIEMPPEESVWLPPL